MVKYDIHKIATSPSMILADAIDEYPKYKETLEKLDALTNYKQYDVSKIRIAVVQGKLVPIWIVENPKVGKNFIFLDKDMKNVATIDDIAKIKPLNANSLNNSDIWKIVSVSDERDKAISNDIKRDNTPIIDVAREVFNVFHNTKKADRVPFDFLAKTVQSWINKAIKDKNTEALGYALMKIYAAYDIDTSKYVGNWKSFNK